MTIQGGCHDGTRDTLESCTQHASRFRIEWTAHPSYRRRHEIEGYSVVCRRNVFAGCLGAERRVLMRGWSGRAWCWVGGCFGWRGLVWWGGRGCVWGEMVVWTLRIQPRIIRDPIVHITLSWESTRCLSNDKALPRVLYIRPRRANQPPRTPNTCHRAGGGGVDIRRGFMISGFLQFASRKTYVVSTLDVFPIRRILRL